MLDVLTDKSYRTYDYISRYSSFPYYYNTETEKYIYGVTGQLSESTDYVLHNVEKGDTYDSIALKYYNSPTFFWIVCDFNRISDPYTTPEIGTKLKIPTLSAITFEG